LDKNSIVKTRQWTVKGPVPPIQVIADKCNNKKITTIGGQGNTLELLMIDIEELRAYCG